MRGPLIDSSIQPRVYMKLFESLVKPIALYGCEVWGGFGHKSALQENILSSVLKNDKPTYEQLHLKVCKQILHTLKRASNLGVRSDLGRLPLMFNIICAVCKYRIRLESYGEDDLLYHALKSQKNHHKTRIIQ